MNSRLGLTEAYNRPRTLSPIHQSKQSSSSRGNTSTDFERASYCKLEREAKHLKQENKRISAEMTDAKLALKQILSESGHEKFDERRLNMIKFQVIQLEKQISVLAEALGTRSEAVVEVENTMACLANKLRSYIAADVKGPLVPIARSDLTSMVEASESSRIKLFKAIESTRSEALGQHLLFLNPFLKAANKQEEPPSLLDISLQRMDYMNLRHVSTLESKMSLLYKELIGTLELLDASENSMNVGHRLAFHVSDAETERFKTSVLKSCVMLRDVTDDLLSLSLLCPTAPWPKLKRPITKEVPIDRILSALPSLPLSKQNEVHHVLEASVHTCNHRHHLLEKQVKVFKEELAFHREIYDLQMQYTKELFDAIRCGYNEFEDSSKKVVCQPLKELLNAYEHLKKGASEASLRKFLTTLKDQEDQLLTVVSLFENSSDTSSNDALSSFGQEFLDKIDLIIQKCQKERDKALREKNSIKTEQARLDLELQHLIEDLEVKYEKQWVPVTNRKSETEAENQDGQTHTPVPIDNNRRYESEAPLSCEQITSRNGSMKKRSKDARDNKKNSMLDDPTKLRSFLDDDSENSQGSDNENISQTVQTKSKKKWVYDFVLDRESSKHNSEDLQESASVISESSQGVKIKHTQSKTKKKIWMPDKEWANDFSSRTAMNFQDSESISTGHSEKKTWSPINQNENGDDEETKCLPYSNMGKKEESKKEKESLSYRKKPQVAQKTLKLRRAGSLSSISKFSDTNS